MNRMPVFTATGLLSVCLFLSACGPTLYVPNTVNAPMLAQKGDWKGSIGFVGNSPGTAALDLQGAYAVTDHAAVMGNVSTLSKSPKNDNSVSHHLLEGGYGRYKSFGKNRCGVNLGRLEIFGGAGMGWAEDQDNQGLFSRSDQRHLYQGAYQRLFVQPAVGLRSKIVDVSFATRFSYVNFSKFRHFQGGNLLESESFGFTTFEPVLTISVGYKYVKYYMQMGGIHPVGEGYSNFNKVTSDITSTHFNVGLAASPWKQNCPERPPVALAKPRKEKGEMDEIGEIDGTGSEPGKTTTAPAPETPPAPPTLISLQKPNVAICLREGGSPDGDSISVSFNGAFVLQNVALQKKPQCFEVTMKPGEEGRLQIHALSDGQFKPNTVQVVVRDGKKERIFYVRTEAGRTEEVIFRLE